MINNFSYGIVFVEGTITKIVTNIDEEVQNYSDPNNDAQILNIDDLFKNKFDSIIESVYSPDIDEIMVLNDMIKKFKNILTSYNYSIDDISNLSNLEMLDIIEKLMNNLEIDSDSYYIESKIQEYKQRLTDTDYHIIKSMETGLTVNEEILKNRSFWREEINRLKDK